MGNIYSVFKKMCESSSHQTSSFCQLFKMFASICSQITNAKISRYYPKMVQFFLQAFDMRVDLARFSFEQINEIETEMLESFGSFVLKLSEELFKPLFLKVNEWSNLSSQPHKMYRKAFFYKWLSTLASNLRGILVPMFGYVLDGIMEVIQHPLMIFDSAKDVSSEQKAQLATETLLSCVSALGKCFQYDSIKFITKERFETILNPLVNVLDFHHKSWIEYSRLVPVVVDALGQLAVCIHNPLLWKPLQNFVLSKTRDNEPEVRCAALLVFKEFYVELAEEFLPMLPESIPYIAELLEDPEEQVESLCQEVIHLIDDFLGDEKIEDYL